MFPLLLTILLLPTPQLCTFICWIKNWIKWKAVTETIALQWLIPFECEFSINRYSISNWISIVWVVKWNADRVGWNYEFSLWFFNFKNVRMYQCQLKTMTSPPTLLQYPMALAMEHWLMQSVDKDSKKHLFILLVLRIWIWIMLRTANKEGSSESSPHTLRIIIIIWFSSYFLIENIW